jgi:hypothetical protein
MLNINKKSLPKFIKFGTEYRPNCDGRMYIMPFPLLDKEKQKKTISRIITKLVNNEKAPILINSPETGMNVNFGKSNSSIDGIFLKYTLKTVI